jgi:membrane associated rhomboid family serine protease
MKQGDVSYGFRRPTRGVMWLMVAIGCIWVMFAMAINWGGGGVALFELLAGSDAVFRGQVWRLVTASLLHHPRHPMHPLIVAMLLYFFATPLEERWGAKRMFLFLGGSAALAFLIQLIAGALFSGVHQAQWFGGMAMAEAAAVAWAFGARGQTVRLFFVLPVKPMVMVALFGVWNVINVIAQSPEPEGMISPFGAMLAGWLLCDASPLRRTYLKLKLKKLQTEVNGMQKSRAKAKRRRDGPDLRVIRGGDDDDDDSMLH